MTNIRTLAEKDLAHTLEGEFAVPIILISPYDGKKITETVDGRPLAGRVLWSHQEINPETGESVIVPTPVVDLRVSSLPIVPKSGEKWLVQIPSDLTVNAPMKNYLLDEASVVEVKRNFGIVSLPLVEVEDEEAGT